MVVLLPAPFGPRNPKSSPFFTLKLMPSTAVKPNFFSSLSTVIASNRSTFICKCHFKPSISLPGRRGRCSRSTLSAFTFAARLSSPIMASHGTKCCSRAWNNTESSGAFFIKMVGSAHWSFFGARPSTRPFCLFENEFCPRSAILHGYTSHRACLPFLLSLLFHGWMSVAIRVYVSFGQPIERY